MTPAFPLALRITLATLLACTLAPTPTRACAPAPPPGHAVTIHGEEAIIFWDAAAGVEHFIRRASFETEAPGFGFLVPTPSVPELAEAADEAFSRLAMLVAPAELVRHETSGVELGCTVLSMRSAGDASAGAPLIEVLRHQQVAGYDAVVLAARDPQALVQWLATNGYAHSDDLAQWAAPYVEKAWTFTAFKLATPQGERGLSTSAVRMSFRTDRPFYPYREPQGQQEGTIASDRALRVFFVADRRFAGDLPGPATWPGQTTYARALPEGSLATSLLGLAPKGAYLTTFLDESNPRPGTDDVWFSVAEEQADVVPEPVVHTVERPVFIPLDLLVVVLVPVVGVVMLVRRRRRARG
jgi:hypothetical protein